MNLGKHERQEIEDAEKIVVDLLNKKIISAKQKKNKWIKHSLETEKAIIRDFGDIKQAEHIGNTYGAGEIGDIKILTDDWIYIELKMSESKKGKGTLANISQNALTVSNLFRKEDIMSWSEFRDHFNFPKRVLDLLNEYKEYPSNLGSGSINNQIKKKGAFLKKKFIEKTGNKNIANVVCKYINTPSISQVASIICTIIKLARQDKIDYLNYLKDIEQDPEHIKKFIIAMYIGYHTREQLNHILNLKYNDIFKILNTYYVYYTNERRGKILVSKDDLGKEIQEIIKSDVKIAFADDQTNCIIQSNDKKILRVVYHWKNKFQGIQTPCLNIFKVI